MLAIYRLPHRFFGESLYIKTCILNHSIRYAIKSVCFDFRSTNVGSSVIGTSSSEGSLLPYFYRFLWHYPLITYQPLRGDVMFFSGPYAFRSDKIWLFMKFIFLTYHIAASSNKCYKLGNQLFYKRLQYRRIKNPLH